MKNTCDRDKRGCFVKGFTPWNKGKRGLYCSPNKGKTYEEIHGVDKANELRLKSRNKKALFGSNNPFWGRHHTKETKEKNAKAHRGKITWAKDDPKFRRAFAKSQSAGFGTYERTAEIRGKLSSSLKGREVWNKGITPSNETRHKLSKSVKEKIQCDPEYRKQVLLALEKARKEIHRRPNKKEQQLIQLINQNKFPFKYTGDGSLVMGGYIPDFVNCDGKKQIIELFGDYWHNRNKMPWHQTELGRIMAYSQFGYKTLIIWEHELKAPDEVITKIRQFMKMKRYIDENL